MNHKNPILRTTRAAFIAVIASVGIVGCSATSSNSDWNAATTVDNDMLTAQANVTALHQSDIDNLENLQPGTRRELIYPLWGAETSSFVVNERYFSALGRMCLRVSFTHAGRNVQAEAIHHGVICPMGRNGWGVTPDLAQAQVHGSAHQ